MGAIVGCTKELCINNNITNMNLEIKDHKLENLYTINTNKNEQTKPALNEIENGHNNNLEEEKEKEEESNNIFEEEEEEGEEEVESEKSNENNGKYKKELSKIKLIQKAYKLHSTVYLPKEILNKNSLKNNNIENKDEKDDNHKYEKAHSVIAYTPDNNLEKVLHKYEYSLMNPGRNKNGSNGVKNEEEQIISLEQTYLPEVNKKSSKILNNFRAMETLKPLLLQKDIGNHKENFIKPQEKNQNYLKILSDFGEKGNSLFKNNDINKKSNKYIAILSNKEKKETRIRQNKDAIKGNFIMKNEKVIRYQGGFIKKTKKKNGFGIVTWSDNSTLHGIYSSSVVNGICRFYNNKQKSTFIGEYINNTPKGFGVYQVKNLALQGYWDGSVLNGIAIEVWDDGTYYQGEYENNKKNGIGLYRWPDGTIYQGQFINGQMTGNGIILYSDDSIFSGEMLNGYMNGYGIFSWGNGPLYMGYYLQDIKHGFGIYIWDTKMFICYIGFWEMGKQQGIGAKINGNKVKYCIWNKGKIATTLKGLYEIDRYLTGVQKGYYHFFTAGYITKLRSSSFYNFNSK